jgi:dipeptidyl aminopeptidase/acylaminoacyl peptidase
LRAFRPRDIFHLRRLQDVAIAPDGESIAYSLQQPDPGRSGYLTRIYRLGAGDGAPRPITGGPDDHRPWFAPDGRHLAFLRRATDVAQVHLLPLSGGEAVQLTSLRHGVDDFAWGPHGRQIAAVAPVGPDGRTTRQLYQVHLDGTWRQLSDDGFDHREPAVAPDGRTVACALERPGQPVDGMGIALVSTDGGPWRIAAPWQRLWAQPVFAPDGSCLYAIGAQSSEAPTIWRIPIDGRPPEHLPAPPWPLARVAGGRRGRTLQSGLFLTGDGQAMLALLGDGRVVALGRLSLGAGRWQLEETPGRRIASFAATPSGDRIGLIAGPPDQPPEAQLRDESGRAVLRSDHQDLFLADVTFAPRRAADADEAAGVLLPQGSDGPWPLVVLLGDQPDPATGGSSSLLAQTLAGLDLAVLQVPLVAADAARWAHEPADLLHDLRRLWRSVVARHRAVDAGRLGIHGHGLGGYLALMLLAASREFKAAATFGAATDLIPLYGLGDLEAATGLGDLPPPWQQPDLYLRRSPLLQAGSIEAPLLLLHGQDAGIVPSEQALELRHALARLGRTVRCEIFSGLGDEPLAAQPLRLQAQILDETAAWLHDHLAR